MFDIGFTELVVIGIVALLVIGPERLPGAIRTGSLWLRRLKRGFNDIRQEVEQELHNDAVMRELRDTREELDQHTRGLRQQVEEAETTLSRELKTAEGKDEAADTGADTTDRDRKQP